MYVFELIVNSIQAIIFIVSCQLIHFLFICFEIKFVFNFMDQLTLTREIYINWITLLQLILIVIPK